jgi:hypothetical protein
VEEILLLSEMKVLLVQQRFLAQLEGLWLRVPAKRVQNMLAKES